MKKLIFVMVAAFGLMFVSCKTTPNSGASSTSTSNVTSDSTLVVEESSVSDSSVVSDNPAVVKPGKPEVKNGVDVTTPAKPTEEANKSVEEVKK